ncbi:MAG: ABC transporter permease, partial [Comamonadaceae bacterium CG17_big_fil_post_rev_8_21_14_2_50_60_13]
ADLSQAQARIAQILAKSFADKQLSVRTFEQLNPFYGQTIKMFDVIFGFISALIGAIVLFMLSNTMSMT